MKPKRMSGRKKVLMIVGIIIAACIVLSIVISATPSGKRITGMEGAANQPTETPRAAEQQETEEPESVPIEQPQEAEDVSEASLNAETQKSSEPKEIPGSYTTDAGYQVEIGESVDGTSYPFTITFSVVGRNYVTGTMRVGREIAFENNGFESCDEGKLTFYQKNGAVYLKYAGNVNGSFDTQLKRETVKDYSGYNVDDYSGTYYSPTEAYEIELLATPGRSFFVNLRYATGVEDYGDAVPGVESSLENGAIITLNINDDQTIHIKLVSAVKADGIFDEDLIPGTLMG